VPELSILIPARNEMWLRRTVEDILHNARADTEVIIVADGAWPEPPLEQHPRVQIVYHPSAVGQRAATNDAARVSTAKFVMKVDAHCAFAEGFDAELIRAAGELGEETTQIPSQKNLHVFDWVCIGGPGGTQTCGWRKYQGPTPTIVSNGVTVPGCPKCQGEVDREVLWRPRRGTTTNAWRFDRTLHFQYFGEFNKRPQGKGELTETMSCLGACWFMSRDRFWKLGGLDEAHGSWGQMGTEIACKSWLSGGRMIVNRRTWYAHLFRTQGGDFGFPYEMKASAQEHARQYSRDLWNNNRWPGQVRPLSWLVDHFAPVPGWEGWQDSAAPPESVEAVPSAEAPVEAPAVAPARRRAGILYYSDCRGETEILEAAKRQLLRAANGHEVVSVTLAPVAVGRNVVLPAERGILTMFEQILRGLEELEADYVFFAEHDVLYHPSHFAFVPEDDRIYFYNLNVWKVDARTGHALHYITKQTSGLCASRELLLQHYRKRVERVKKEGFTRRMGFEPGTHAAPRGVDDFPSASWYSEAPNVDIRHSFNLTQNRWRQDQFRDQRCCQGWKEAEEVPGWGHTGGRFDQWLREVTP
jgi:hypothetical protein